MQKAPALIGDCNIGGKSGRIKIFAVITTLEKMKLIQHEIFVTPFQYKLYMNGAKKAPAKAPHETPIN